MSHAFAGKTIWLIGVGNMGGAMLRGWLNAGASPTDILVIDPFASNLPDGVGSAAQAPQDALPPDIVVLAVKPQMLDQIVLTLAPTLGSETLLLSILAGVEIASLRQRFTAPQKFVRMMPNTPVAIGKGVVAIFGEQLEAEDAKLVDQLMAPLGLIEWISSEGLFDAVTALSGCGPAFLFRFVDAFAKAGIALGLPEEQAVRFAIATTEGAALLASASQESPATLADRVASPGGATREGLNVLDADNAINLLLAKTLRAAADRSAELAAAARG